jgi:hypothetical protein
VWFLAIKCGGTEAQAAAVSEWMQAIGELLLLYFSTCGAETKLLKFHKNLFSGGEMTRFSLSAVYFRTWSNASGPKQPFPLAENHQFWLRRNNRQIKLAN